MDKPKKISKDKLEKIHEKAIKRSDTCFNMDKHNRKEMVEDLEMLAGIGHWPDSVVSERSEDDRPTLMINKLPVYSNRVINEARINEIRIKVSPMGSTTSKDLSDIMSGHIRSIERESKAKTAYLNAYSGAVQCGVGWVGIVTDYTSETSFDQEISIRKIKNHLSVRCDPKSVQEDASDSDYMFVDELMSREEYEDKYPDQNLPSPLVNSAGGMCWADDDFVQVSEYWVKEPKRKKIYLLSDGRTVYADEWDKALPSLIEKQQMMHFAPVVGSPIPGPQPAGQPLTPGVSGSPPATLQTPVQNPGPASGGPQMPSVGVEMRPGMAPSGSGLSDFPINRVPDIVRARTVDSHVVRMYIMDGEKIIDGPYEWAGLYIPLIRVTGEEISVGNKVYRRGTIRFAKDPQRMYNYFRTAATETVAMTPKAPWVGTEEQFEGHEHVWDTANTGNHSRLTYNHIPGVNPPQRAVVTQTAIGEITEANISSDEIKDTTGIQDAAIGAKSNEVSGAAISRRTQQSEVVNYTYFDNLVTAVGQVGKVLVDLIPRIYDTEREITILDDIGEEKSVKINQVDVNPTTGVETRINDITMGRYKVSTEAGPSFRNQKEVAAAGMLDFIRTAPDSARVIMDLVAEAQNWPDSTRIANRLKKLLPPGIDGEGPMETKPDVREIINSLKAESIKLGNDKKMLDIYERRKNLTDSEASLVRIVGLLKQLGFDPQQMEGADDQGTA